MPADVGSRRRILEGIARYAQATDTWDILCATQAVTHAEMRPLLLQADGVLASRISMDETGVMQSLSCPWVAVGEDIPGSYRVTLDEAAIGGMAAGHFRSLGLRHTAYCGWANVAFAEARREGLRTAAESAGLSFHAYGRTIYAQMDSDPHELMPFQQWLRGLPKPVGLLCTVVEVAHVVLHHCRRLGIRVPQEIAVLGVDDDEVLCEITRPHLSTIDQAVDEVGYRAAQMLDRLMAGETLPRESVLVQPRKVIARESTDLIFSDNPAIGQAVRYIRENLAEDLTVEQILKHVPMSRRALERGFVRNIGRTIHQEILRVRLERAKSLLATTELKTPDIAERCGLGSAAMLANVFRRELRMTPTEYRRAERTGGAIEIRQTQT